ncbi:hypothetical protein B484DRAFT_410661, partial [Ochromonadaceae sp. CCMP2298]
HSSNDPADHGDAWEPGDVFCLVRVGATLTYPITTSYGYSEDGGYPSSCSKRAAAQ